MEENNVKVKNKAKLTVVFLIAFLLLGAAVGAAFLLMPKKNVTENQEVIIKYEEEETAADEATLRELLTHDSNIIIEVTEDIMINQPITVNGGKKLTGDGTIAMELYVKPYQYMFVVSKDSKLELDGVTIDGSGSSNCVKVEKNAQLSLLSGKMTYGCPTVIESFGNIYIKGGSIVDAIGTGIYAHSGASVYMTAGSVRSCVDTGIEVATGGYLSVSEKAVLNDNMEYFIYNEGTCDITGGTLRNAHSYLVFNSGELNVKKPDTHEGMLEWYDIKGCAIAVGKGGKTNIDGLHIRDIEMCAITTYEGSNAVHVSNSLFENVTWDTIYVRTEVNLTNVEIKKAGKSGIMLIENAKAHLDNVTISETVKDGIQNAGGTVTGKNLTVNTAGRVGVNTYKVEDAAGSVSLNNVTIDGTKGNGLHVETSSLTASNVKIRNAEGDGARVQKVGTLKLTNVDIQDTKGINISSYDEGSKAVLKNVKTNGGKRGIGAFGGNVSATKVSIDSPTEYGVTGSTNSNVNVTDVTIKNSGKMAINANAATVKVDKATIENPKQTAGLNADFGGNITLKNADVKFAEGTEGNIDGVKAGGPATITLENVNITNAPRHGIYADGKDAKVVTKNVTTTGGKRGVQILKGGQVEGETVTIKSPKEYGITCGDEGSGFNFKKLTVNGCGTTAVNVYDGANGTVTNGTLKKTGVHAGYVGNKAKLTLTTVVISDTTKVALWNSSATLNVTGGSVDKAGEDSVKTSGGGLTNLSDYKITNSTGHNIRVENANTKCVLKNVQSTGGKRGIQIWSGAIVEGEKVTITKPAEYGITCGEEGSGFSINGLTVTESGRSALNVYDSAVAEASDVTIVKPSEHAGFVGNKGQLTVKDIDVSETVLTAFISNNATLNINGGSLKDAGEHGVFTYKAGQTTLTDFEIEDSKNHNIRVDDADSKCLLNNVSTSGGERGVQIYTGGQVEGNIVSISSPTAYGVACSAGSFEITDLQVSGSTKHAVNLYAASHAKMIGGNIENSKENGIVVGERSELDLSGDITISNSTLDNLYVTAESKATINGTVTTNGGRHGVAIYNGADVTQGEQQGTITINNPNENGVRLYNSGSSLDIDVLNVNNSKAQALEVNDSGTAKIDGGLLTVSNAASGDMFAVKAQSKAKVTLNNVELKNPINNALVVWSGSQVYGSNLKVTQAGKQGVWCSDANSIVDIDGLTLTGCKGDGIRVSQKAQVALKGTVTITSPAWLGIRCELGTVSAADAVVTIQTPGEYGVRLNGASSGTIGTLNVTGAKAHSAVRVQDTASLTINGGTIKDSQKHGVNATGTTTLIMKNVTITNSGLAGGTTTYYDIQNESGNATITLTNVTYSKKNF